jgi:hypothetical protein
MGDERERNAERWHFPKKGWQVRGGFSPEEIRGLEQAMGHAVDISLIQHNTRKAVINRAVKRVRDLMRKNPVTDQDREWNRAIMMAAFAVDMMRHLMDDE